MSDRADEWQVPALDDLGREFERIARREERAAASPRRTLRVVACGGFACVIVVGALAIAWTSGGRPTESRAAASGTYIAAVRAGTVRFRSTASWIGGSGAVRSRTREIGAIDLRRDRYTARFTRSGEVQERFAIGRSLFVRDLSGRGHSGPWATIRSRVPYLRKGPGSVAVGLTDPLQILRFLREAPTTGDDLGVDGPAGKRLRHLRVSISLVDFMRALGAPLAGTTGVARARERLSMDLWLDRRGRVSLEHHELRRGGSVVLSVFTTFDRYGATLPPPPADLPPSPLGVH